MTAEHTIADVLANRARWAVEVSDCIDGLRSLPAGCVQTCVTSVPYWGLRSYLPADHPDKAREIGSEPTPEEFIATMVRVFGEVRRVLHDTGTLFINLGDSYAMDDKWGGSSSNKNEPKQGYAGRRKRQTGGKSGDLLNMPHRVAEALRDDGWFWRQTVVWSKPAPMPESIGGWRWEQCRVKLQSAHEPLTQYGQSGNRMAVNHSSDIRNSARAKWAPCPGCPKCIPNGGLVLRRGKWRCTTAHEYLFLFSKSEVYFCDQMAALEGVSGGAHARGHGVNPKSVNGEASLERQNAGFSAAVHAIVEQRNPRSVWTINTEPLKLAHFAAYPSELVRRCLVASTSAKGCCPACGMPVVPIVERSRVATRPGTDTKVYAEPPVHADSPVREHSGTVCGNRDPQRHVAIRRVIGWRPSCECGLEPVSHIVLDPFSGAGTTVMTAKRLGLRGIGFDLNPEYVAMSRRRIERDRPKYKNGKAVKPSPGQRELFTEATNGQ